MRSATKRVTFLIPETYRPLTPPLTPTVSFSPKSTSTFLQESNSPTSTSNKLKRLQASSKKSLRYPSHVTPIKINLELHPLPLNSFSSLNSPTSPLSIHSIEEGVEEESYLTIDTKINTDSLEVDFDFDLSDYYSTVEYNSSNNSSDESTTISPSNQSHLLRARGPSLLNTFPLPPARFSTKEQQRLLNLAFEAEEKFLEARRLSCEANERVQETKFDGLLIENHLEGIQNRMREISE